MKRALGALRLRPPLVFFRRASIHPGPGVRGRAGARRGALPSAADRRAQRHGKDCAAGDVGTQMTLRRTGLGALAGALVVMAVPRTACAVVPGETEAVARVVVDSAEL